MFHNNEVRVMKDPRISSGRFSCRQIFAPLVRWKKPGSPIRCFHMWQTHLLVIIVLFAGQASCNQTSTTSSPLTGSTTATQITAFYVVEIEVTGPSQNESEIYAWLNQVFRTNLENCVSPNPAQTTATPASPQTTPASTFNETTQVTVLQSNSTDATSPALEGNNTTTVSTTLEDNNATTATTSEGNNTTTVSTTLEDNNATTATTSEGNNTTPAATTSEGNNATTATTSEGNNTTPAATTSEGNNATTATTSEGNNTTPAATTSEGNITTRAATLSEGNNTISTATTSEGNNLTTIATTATSEDNNNTATVATTSKGINTTSAATTSEGNNITTIATTATSEGNNNTATVSTISTGTNTTPAATTSTGINTTPAPTSSTGISTTPATTTLRSNNNPTPAATKSTSISTTPTTTTSTDISTTPTTTTSTDISTTPTTTTSTVISTTPTTTTSTEFSTTPTTTSTDINTTPTTTTSTEFSTTTTTTSTDISTTPTTTTSTDISTTPTTTTSTDISTTTTTTTSTTEFSTTTTTTTSTDISTTPTTTSTDISTTPTTTTSTEFSTTTTTTSTDINTTPTTTISTGFTTVTSTQNTNSPSARRKRRGIPPNSNSVLPPQIRSVREVSGNNTQSLFQEMNVSCAIKTAISNTSCSVTLKLSQPVPSCCILRTLCAASNTTSAFSVVAKRADRIDQLQNECNSSCVYSGQANATCNASAAAYVVPQNNSANCSANINCSCSNYCNGSDAYYTFEISTQDPKIGSSYFSNLISSVQPSVCNQTAKYPCPFNITSHFKNASVGCQNQSTNYSCKVILVFARELSICSVADAVMFVIQSEKQIFCNGRVIRAAICGNVEVSSNLLSDFTWDTGSNLTSANFCAAAESNSLTCQSGKNVVVQLQEQCVAQEVSTTTTSPNVTSVQPNSTTIAINVTSTPLNTTTAPLNTTEAGNVTTTTSAGNVSLTTQNTTTTNQSTSVTTVQPPATTASAEDEANALLELTKDVSKLNSSQVNQLVSQLEGLLSRPTVSLALGNTSVNVVSNLLGASPDVLSASSNRIIGIVDTVGLKLTLGATFQNVLSPAVAVSVKSADGANFQQTVFSISNPTDVQVRGASRRRRSGITDSSIPQGSIKLPPTLTQNLPPAEQKLVSRVHFNFYQKSTVFQDKSLGVRRLNSGILGASVANLSITELKDNVTITLKNKEPVPANFVATCVFWNFTFNNGSGGWSSNGCSVQNSTDNETICACNHLTSFAILLDLSRTPITSRTQSIILTFITYIGCGVSAIFLSITLLTYLAFGKLRKDIPSKILIQLCLALLMLNLVFLVDAWLALYPDAVGLCISTAWFLHYFLLASFTWMGLEAVHMYVALVKVFNLNVSHYMLKFSLAGWGVPMIVVIIVISIKPSNYGLVQYGRFTDGTTDDFCWLKDDIAFYVAVVAYFCAIFLFNVIMFIVVMVQLCRIKRQNPHNLQHRSTLQDVRSVMGITVLLGLTWGFAFFAWGPVNLAFMYLFAIFNALQGFFIFVFHCAAKESVRRQWKTHLCCGKMRLTENSEWSRTATQKTGKKSSVTNHSSRGNNSSSSSSFLVSDVSEQTNGIGSSFTDRVITADEDPNMDVVLNEVNMRHRNRQTS